MGIVFIQLLLELYHIIFVYELKTLLLGKSIKLSCFKKKFNS